MPYSWFGREGATSPVRDAVVLPRGSRGRGAERRGGALRFVGFRSVGRGCLPRLAQPLHVCPPVLGAHRAEAVLAAGLRGELSGRCLVGLDALAGAARAAAQLGGGLPRGHRSAPLVPCLVSAGWGRRRTGRGRRVSASDLVLLEAPAAAGALAPGVAGDSVVEVDQPLRPSVSTLRDPGHEPLK